MRLAILSDIHGNLPALEATADDIASWQPDLVLVNGDIVSGGSQNLACWQFIRERQAAGWLVLRGNHEDYVVEWANPALPTSGVVFELSRLSHWTYQQLNGDVAALAALPDHWNWTATDGTRLLVMHGTLQGIRAGIYPWTPDEEVRGKILPGTHLFVTAHTHIPHLRRLDGTQVVNVGAVGLPGDGDGRASYGRFTWQHPTGWQTEIARVSYDQQQTERDFHTTGFLNEVGTAAWMTLVELRSARDAKTRWSSLYRQRILAGELSVDQSIFEFLSAAEFAPYLSHAEYRIIKGCVHFSVSKVAVAGL